ncbi:hypothetical protein HJC23_006259 [Cyclotella cryptica]|uniref:Uncharacterized protein n=1 Tax=Cyclotella cryptica TaxID=29204 RepID=A0ABD3PN86_9STRA|eukprot:CCRYP_013464-RA/>CCRYP_013464-RA protein AED:0.21 eAED:0.21 QI:273/1/1/1/1/1/3/1479/525
MNVLQNGDHSWSLSIHRHKRERRRRIPRSRHCMPSHRHCDALTCRGGSFESPADTEQSRPRGGPFVRPSFVVEFDSGIGPSYRRGSRHDATTNNKFEHTTGCTLSLSMDASPCLHRTASVHDATMATMTSYDMYRNHTTTNRHLQPSLTPSTAATPISPVPTTILTILTQSALLLPPLLLTRRLLNSTSNAVIDYFRGRYFLTTFTRLERAYLRYYEFPAAIRASWRVASQIGILGAWSWLLRCWMGVVARSEENFNLYSFIRSDVPLDIDWGSDDGCLPCLRAGKGMPWFCGVIWIGAVVGAGHACAMAISKWGGPLRLQAASAQQQQPRKSTHVLSWIVHHPIQWIRELDEWKHFSTLGNLVKTRDINTQRIRRRSWRVFNPDPLLFPATWMPLRWLQIHAIAKAFATDPELYNWCSPEQQTVVIHRLMNIYLVQLALGDEWSRVFLAEYRVGLGIVAVTCYFIALAWMVFTTFTMNVAAAAMLIPSLLAAILSALMNISIFWNRMGTKEQKKALVAMGWTDK